MIYRLIVFACTALIIYAAPYSQAQTKASDAKAAAREMQSTGVSPEEAQLKLAEAMHWSPRINAQYAYPSLIRYSIRTPGNMYNPPPIIMFNNRGDMALIWDPYFHHFKWIAIVPPYPGYVRPPTIIYGPGIYENEEQYAPAEGTQAASVRTSVGEVIRVLPGRTPKMVVNIGGRAASVAISPDALLLRGPIGGRLAEVPMGDIRPGDRVILQFMGQETAGIVRAQYFAVYGKVQSIAVNTILLNTGATLRISAETDIVLPGNITGALQDIKTGDAVVARVAPISGKTFLIKVLDGRERQPSNSEEEGSQINLNSTGPFRAGDVLIIEFNGQPGGKASFTIPGVVANVPMTEVEPGLYRGEYSVTPGDIAIREQLTIRFRSPSGATYTRTSGPLVTIRTMAGYLPQIISPRQGEYISSPLVVKGIAQPGSLVRVTILYRADIQNALPIEGLTAYEDAEADAQGKWQTTPLPAVAPFYEDSSELPDYFGSLSEIFRFPKVEPVMYIVTAASINANGEETAAYSVQVTKAPGRIMSK
ncbi:MAG: hypothetical protein WCT06_02025 [Armatimonadota bacterium]